MSGTYQSCRRDYHISSTPFHPILYRNNTSFPLSEPPVSARCPPPPPANAPPTPKIKHKLRGRTG